jgi:signal peptidase II
VTDETSAARPTDPGAGRNRHRSLWLAIAIAVVVVVLDQVTKFWAEHALADGKSVPFIGDVIHFVLVYNSGSAFSFATNSTWVFTIVAAAAVIVISVFLARVTSLAWTVALGLVLGGAATHLGDRLFRAPGFGVGHVVDFIGYGNWFIGNVADIAIVCGAVMIAVLTLMGVRYRNGGPGSGGVDPDAERSESSDSQTDDERTAPE